ncbi:MAG: NAD(P)H-dependent glycerol-3-phosphate dehydrogenase [Bdellovibrionota bacterium]
MRKKIAVIGSGSWGTAVANVFADAGSQVTIWGRDPKVVEGINASHHNPRYLSAFELSSQLEASADLAKTLAWADVVVCAIPTQKIRSVFGPHRAILSGKWIVNTSKGIEESTYKRISEIFSELAPDSPFAVLSGPTFAEEVVKRLPSAITVACEDLAVATEVQRLFSTPYMRGYASDDVCGVEWGGALKNVVAVATGIASGVGLGLNTQAALINRGIAEIVRMATFKGARPITFLGLSGMGDLVLTCTGDLSRNRRLGIAMGQGKSLEEAFAHLGGVAEGAFTARAAYEMAMKDKIEMPLTEQVYKILYAEQTPKQALTELMGRNLKVEWDFV